MTLAVYAEEHVTLQLYVAVEDKAVMVPIGSAGIESGLSGSGDKRLEKA